MRNNVRCNLYGSLLLGLKPIANMDVCIIFLSSTVSGKCVALWEAPTSPKSKHTDKKQMKVEYSFTIRL